MTKLTEHFTIEELTYSATGIRKGLDNPVPNNLIANMLRVACVLEEIRAHFGKPVRVLSCYRSPLVNKAVGGSKTSAHCYAHAADIRIEGVPVIDVCRWAADNITYFDQIIYEFGEGGWCHIGFTNSAPRGQLLTAAKNGTKTVYAHGLVHAA